MTHNFAAADMGFARRVHVYLKQKTKQKTTTENPNGKKYEVWRLEQTAIHSYLTLNHAHNVCVSTEDSTCVECSSAIPNVK